MVELDGENPLLACITWQLHSSSFHSQCCLEFLLVEICHIQECALQIQCTIVLAFGCRSKHTCEYCIVSITCSTKMHSALPCMSTTCTCFSVCQTVMLNGRCWHLLTSADIVRSVPGTQFGAPEAALAAVHCKLPPTPSRHHEHVHEYARPRVGIFADSLLIATSSLLGSAIKSCNALFEQSFVCSRLAIPAVC